MTTQSNIYKLADENPIGRCTGKTASQKELGFNGFFYEIQCICISTLCDHKEDQAVRRRISPLFVDDDVREMRKGNATLR